MFFRHAPGLSYSACALLQAILSLKTRLIQQLLSGRKTEGQAAQQLFKLFSRNDPYHFLYFTGKVSHMTTANFKEQDIDILQISKGEITIICELALMMTSKYNLSYR